jgi:membrane-associated phospholipid phosphatase
VAVWALYIAGFIAFVHLRTLADETGIPHSAGYPLLLDRLMFLGEVPTAWLQTHFSFEGASRPLVIVLAAVYVSYFLVPHIFAVATWRLRPALFPQVPLALILTLHLGLLVYFVVPTVPPWLAAEYDQTPEMMRILPVLFTGVDSTGYETAAKVAGENDVGAMPSLHMALTVVVATAAASFGRAGKYLGSLYAAMMGLSLVYLGEHYVIDVAAGAAVAYAGWKASGWAVAAQMRRPLLQEHDDEASGREPAARLDRAA